MTTTGATVEVHSRTTTVRTVRMDDELWIALGEIGTATRRSRSNLVNVAIEEYVRKLAAESEAA